MSSHEAWMDNAACAEVGTDLFFPSRDDRAGAKLAQTICASCPVSVQCLEYAIRGDIHHGIFGGLTGSARAKNRRAA